MNSPLRRASHAVSRLGIALVLSAIAALHVGISFAADVSSPVGEWKTFDDKTGKARAIVRIYEQDGKLFGKIERSMAPDAESRVCAVCSDERKDQPMLGLVIIRNMKRTEDGYAGGDILDPDSGWVYRCKMHLDEGGAKLVVRGFFGISLLGRTQIWERQTPP
ncbi:MAG: DUF2147 domain-containing protein [Steroidobacteraceae bacterium]|jgi:uncharacterized protein (DUF2147 family)